MELLIYYGENSHGFQAGGIEAQYAWLLEQEQAIKNALIPGRGWRAKWLDTVLDEDRLPGFKLFASRFSVS